MISSKKNYLLAGLFLLAFILAVALGALPIIRQINTSSHLLAQKNVEIESFLANWQNLEKSKSDYQVIKNLLEEMPVYLPAKKTIEFIKILETISQQTQNSQTISVIKNIDSANKTTNILDLEISLSGSFPNLIKFLIYLENSQYYNNINSIKIARDKTFVETPGEAQTTEKTINTLITLSVYQQNE